MATDGMAGFWDGVAYPAQAERLLTSIDAMPGPVSAPFSARSGRRVNGSGLSVSVSSTGNGSVTVSPGPGQVYSSAHAGHGRWSFYIPNSVGPLTLGARPATGQTRVDLVVAQLYDSGIGVGAVKEVKIEVVPGQAGVSASAPAVPALSMLLDTLTVPATGAISHTQSTDVVVAAGGVLPVQTAAEKNKLKTDGVAYRGLVVDDAQAGALFRYNGDGWDELAVVGDPAPGDQPWTTLTAATGWTAGTGTNKPQVKRVGTRITYKGSLFGGTAGSTATTVPDWARPSSDLGTIRVTATSASNTVGFVRVHANGAFQPSVSLDAETMISWDVG